LHIKKTTWAFLISFLALFLRLYLAYNGPIEFDEPLYATAAIQYNQAMRQGDWNQILDSTYVIEHPQFYKLVYAVGLLPGKSILSIDPIQAGNDLQSSAYWHKLLTLRMISSFLGAAAVFLISLIHPLAGLFLALNTFAIKYTSVIYLEALPALTSLAAVMAALKSLEAYQNNTGSRRRWAGWLVLSSLAMGMSTASKYVYGVVGIVIVIAVIIHLWHQKIPALLGLAGWGFLSLAFFFMLDPVLWHSPLGRLAESIQFNLNYSGGQHVREVGYPFWQPIKWLMLSIPQQPTNPLAFFINKGDFFVPADSLIFILALVGLPAFYLRNKPMFIWLVVGLTFLLLWGTKWPQYILLVLAPFCLSAAYGFDFIRSNFLQLKSRIRGRF
jgi:hypothetical protein